MLKESRIEDIPDITIAIKALTAHAKFMRKFAKMYGTRLTIIISSSTKIKSVGVILPFIRSK